LSKRIGKFRFEDEYSDGWDSSKSTYDSKRRKKNYSEDRKMKFREYEEAYVYGGRKRSVKYSKNSY
jgi:hypothetical protein